MEVIKDKKVLMRIIMIIDLFLISLGNLKKRKARTYLTVLGIVIGIVTIVALISLGQGLQNTIDKQFERIGKNRLIITPGSGDLTGMSPVTSEFSASKLYTRDIETVKKSSGVEIATGAIIKTATVVFKGETAYLSASGISTTKKELEFVQTTNNYDAEFGRLISPGETRVAVIGYRVSNDDFSREVKTGDEILINNLSMKVIGVLKKSGNPISDNSILISIDDAKEIYEMDDEVTTIFAKAEDKRVPSEVAEEVRKNLAKERGVKKGEEDFTVKTAEQVIDSFGSIITVVQLFLIGIATISLLVGIIGITNTMFISVIERKAEIGIMKAIGARNSDIALVFMFESGIMGLIGGIIGVGVGILIGKGVGLIATIAGVSNLAPYFSIELIVGTILFSFLLGIFAGTFPAINASKLNPVEILREE